MKHIVWLSYDLGVTGDYRSLYEWLDTHGAKECGDSVAFFIYEHTDADPRDALQKDLTSHVSVDEKKDRIYVVIGFGEGSRGRFIVGRRKSPPWAGYGVVAEQTEDAA